MDPLLKKMLLITYTEYHCMHPYVYYSQTVFILAEAQSVWSVNIIFRLAD